MEFNHKIIEEKWLKYWEENKTFKTDTSDFSKPKFFIKFFTIALFPLALGPTKTNISFHSVNNKMIQYFIARKRAKTHTAIFAQLFHSIFIMFSFHYRNMIFSEQIYFVQFHILKRRTF